MDELKQLGTELNEQIRIALGLKIAVETLVKFAQAPYHGTTDWEAKCREIMVESGKALCKIEAIIDPKPPQVPS